MKNTNENKVNRYTILRDEVLGLSAQKKQKKQEYVKACAAALADYRKWVKDVYKVGKKAALDKFAASKKVVAKKVTEKKASGKKVVIKQSKVTGTNKTVAECIAAGEKAIATAKAKAKAAK